jgi:hypothetical protein
VRRAAVLAAGLALLAGCMGETEAPWPPEAVDDPEERAACEAEGGTYRIGGLLQEYVCFRPTPDAGASCTSGDDCTGFCLAETRSCAPVTPMFGCHAILTEDGSETVICVD